MTRFPLYPLFIAGALALTGCTIFQLPTPKNNLQMDRNALVKSAKGDERTAPVSTLKMPEKWATGASSIKIQRKYVNHEGAEVMIEETVEYNRTSDAGPAAALAGQQGQRVVESGAMAGAFLGSLAAGMFQTQQLAIQADRDVAIIRETEETKRATPIEAEHSEPPAETEPATPPAEATEAEPGGAAETPPAGS